MAIARARASTGGDRIGLAWIDISTAEFIVTECALGELAATLARINPNEAIVTDALYSDPELGPLLRELAAVTPLTRDVFDSATAERRLCDYFAVATMDGLAAMSRLEATAAAACITYVERTQLGQKPPLSPPSREIAGATMAIDPATRANLELTRTLAGERRGSLLDAIDCTVTAAGSRLLAQRLAAPLTDAGAIAQRLDAVEAFVADPILRDGLRATLRAAPDLARSLARLSVGRGGPRDLAALRDGLLAADEALAQLSAATSLPQEILAAMAALQRPSRELADEFSRALADELPLQKRDGGFVRANYQAALDETRALRDASRQVVAAMQARYADDSGVKGLKIRHNNVLGYFVEVTAQHGEQADGRAAQCDLHPSPDPGRAGSLHHRRTRRDRSQDRQCRRARARPRAGNLRALDRDGDRGDRRSARRRACVRGCSTSRWRWRSSRSMTTTCGPRSMARCRSRSKAAAIRWSSRR